MFSLGRYFLLDFWLRFSIEKKILYKGSEAKYTGQKWVGLSLT